MPITFSELVSAFTDSPTLLIPLWEVLLFVVLISVAAMFERHRLILVVAYSFSVFWVFVENLKLLAMNRTSVVATLVFVVFGLLGLFLTIYHALTGKD
jgi:hypothetical protein